MPRKQVIGLQVKEDIKESIKGCRTSKEIAAVVEGWSIQLGVGKDRIYAVTRDVRNRRKTRSDKGKRTLDVHTDLYLRKAIGRILAYDISTAESLNMSSLNGEDIGVCFTTVNRWMREDGLDKKSRRDLLTPHKRFEAKAPGEMFQFDISGLKTRWFDHKTRRIITVPETEVSKNHPNEKASRVRVWRFALIDDYSRRVFLRYYAVGKANSSHVVDFLLRAYSEMGVPFILYTDNDAIIKFKRNARTTEILNKSLHDRGGYRNWFHLPGNSKATGKVERVHPTIENLEKFIGILIDQGRKLTIEDLNETFAPRVMHKLNVIRVHGETGQPPMERWKNTLSVIRTLSYEDLKSAFMADVYPITLRGDLTFRLSGQSFQLPGSEAYPFADWAARKAKLTVVFPDDQEFFTLIGLDGLEYDIPKQASVIEAAGQSSRSKADVEGSSLKLRKELTQLAREDAKNTEAPNKAIPYFDDDIPEVQRDSGILDFPKPEQPIEIERVQREAPGRVATQAHNPAVNFWEAFDRYHDRFASKAECKEFMDSIFTSRDEECWLLQSEIESHLDSRSAQTQPVRKLMAVS